MAKTRSITVVAQQQKEEQQTTKEAIMVGMRLRPLVGNEKGQQHCIKIQGNIVSIVGEVTGVNQEFAFDVAMDSTNQSSPSYVSQAKCYELMGHRMLEHMLQGYHTCLFCYGQTGTGKTTTIMGKAQPPGEQGILLRLITDVYEEVGKLRTSGYSVEVRVQMLEVYNERLNDLLLSDMDGKKKTKLDVRVHPELGVYVTGAREEVCETYQDCVQLIEYGNTMKTVHATAMNAQSSRGHTVFKLSLERRGGDDHRILTSEVYFADLAGRENERTTQVSGDRLVELSFINRSLMWLANCIQSLGAEQSPTGRRRTVAGATALMTPKTNPKRDMAKFRNSKLTLLLSNSLNGNSRTAMIGTLSPALANFEESYSTLKFAKTVKNIRLEARAATAIDQETLVRMLTEEIHELRRQLREAKDKRDISNVHEVQGQLEFTEAILAAKLPVKDMARLTREESLKRAATMARLGTKQTGDSLADEGTQLPYLANYNDDDYLFAKFKFHIPPDGKERSLGLDGDFPLPRALGILAVTGHIRNEGGRIFLRAAQSGNGALANIEVNSHRLCLEWKELEHLDRILFGRHTTFYLITEATPDAEIMTRAKSYVPKETSQGVLTDLRDVIGEERALDSVQVSWAQEWWTVHEQTQRIVEPGSNAKHQWLHLVRLARRLVGEANEITERMSAHLIRPGDGLFFELVTVAPVLSLGYGQSNLPEIAVQCVRRKSDAYRWENGGCRLGMSAPVDRIQQLLGTCVPLPVGSGVASARSSLTSDVSDAPMSSVRTSPSLGSRRMSEKRFISGASIIEGVRNDVELLFTWSWHKFTVRLELMRGIYETWSDDEEGFKMDPYNNPWAEFGPAELTELGQDHAEQLREHRETIRQRDMELTRIEEENNALRQQLLQARAALEATAAKAVDAGGVRSPPASKCHCGNEGRLLTQVSRCEELSRSNVELLSRWVEAVKQR